MYEKELSSMLAVLKDLTKMINLVNKFNAVNDSINKQVSERKLLRDELKSLNKELSNHRRN